MFQGRNDRLKFHAIIGGVRLVSSAMAAFGTAFTVPCPRPRSWVAVAASIGVVTKNSRIHGSVYCTFLALSSKLDSKREPADNSNHRGSTSAVITASTYPIEIPLVTLASVAQILRAPLFKSEKNLGTAPYKIVSVKDFPEAGYITQVEKTVAIANNRLKAENYLLRPHDLLVTIVGNIGSVALVPEGVADNWLPATNMFILRFEAEAELAAISAYVFFKSLYGRAVLDILTHGSTIELINKKSFSQIGIPKLVGEVRKQSKRIFQKEQKLFEKREALRQEANEAVEEYWSVLHPQGS